MRALLGYLCSVKHNNEINELKKDLEGWREVLLPLSRILAWEKPYHPFIILGVVTFLFAIVWYFEPSILTTFSLLGFLFCLIDFLVPIIGPSLCSAEKWTGVQEQQYEQVCERFMHARDHFCHAKNMMGTLKAEKPKVYFILVMGLLILFAWLGYLVDNFFLTYIIVSMVVMLPGMRQHRIIQRYLHGVGVVLKRLIFGKPTKKAKAN
ncbi:hypothetical protein ScPMuIL_004650 [Solemya velum]